MKEIRYSSFYLTDVLDNVQLKNNERLRVKFPDDVVRECVVHMKYEWDDEVRANRGAAYVVAEVYGMEVDVPLVDMLAERV